MGTGSIWGALIVVSCILSMQSAKDWKHPSCGGRILVLRFHRRWIDSCRSSPPQINSMLGRSCPFAICSCLGSSSSGRGSHGRNGKSPEDVLIIIIVKMDAAEQQLRVWKVIRWPTSGVSDVPWLPAGFAAWTPHSSTVTVTPIEPKSSHLNDGFQHGGIASPTGGRCLRTMTNVDLNLMLSAKGHLLLTFRQNNYADHLPRCKIFAK